ncbi:MAG: hypothetical protein KAJ19_29615 [Gammaproteobacteria bacterium]|nr:hypothetical protein [Gammaproteobacteria bacterium]
MQFNRKNLNTFRSEINTALAAIEAKHGVKFEIGRITFTDNNFRTRLECTSASDKSGNAVDPRQTKFEANSWKFNIAKDAFGKTFSKGGRKYKIVGLNPRAKKYPLQCEAPNGQQWKMPLDSLPTNLRAR